MHRWTPRRSVVGLWLALVLVFAPAQIALGQDADSPSLILILDASGSMWGQIEGKNKIVIAREALGALVDDLASKDLASKDLASKDLASKDLGDVALVAYGHRRKGDCDDIETVIPLGPLDPESLKTVVEGLQPKGKTPITASVEQALALTEGRSGGSTLILLSDGLETCGGDPCKVIRLAKESGKSLVLHVVGFDIAGEDTSQLQCMAQAGGGLFYNAEDAAGLSAALEAAVALPVDVPVGRLAVLGVADGELHDVSIHVSGPEGKQVAGARTYTSSETNPSSIPLADGSYEVKILGMGLEGDPEQSFSIEIVDGNTVEKTVDFSTGEVSIGVTRNGELSDAVFKVYGSSGKEVASGRTYVSPASNPAKVRLTAGTYDIEVESVEIKGDVNRKLGTVEVTAKGSVELKHDFKSGTLKVGAVNGTERVDAVVRVSRAEDGKSVGQARTYTGAKTNPKTFELEPGRYRIHLKTVGKTVGKEKKQLELEAEVRAGETVGLDGDFAAESQ